VILSESPEVIFEAARQRTVSFALQANFSIDVDSESFSGSTKGAMILHRPDRMRFDILSPLNTPLAYLASDGQALHAWVQQERTFYRGDDIGDVLDHLLRGAAGISDFIDVLTGVMPLPAAEVIDTRFDAAEGLLEVALSAAQETQMRVWIEPESRLLKRIVLLSPEDQMMGQRQRLLRVDYVDYMRLENQKMPKEISMRFPTVGWSVGLKINTWNRLGQIPEVFTLKAPPGAVQKDLVQTLQEMARNQLRP